MPTSTINKALTTRQICAALRDIKQFVGVFPRDRLPVLKKLPAFLVINTDSADEPGEHWIAVCISRQRQAIFFNSFGLPPLSADVVSFIDRYSNRLEYCNVVLQNAYSTVCGFYCIAFVRHMANGGTLSRFVSQFVRRGGSFSRTGTNDDVVVRLLRRILTRRQKAAVGLS